ncbi:MAG: Na+/H+ antiporter subunit E [Gammaproteobacteria bacterium]|nr:Na+/H+ antiporter subunit E [Gammaproteobacteria bacterium]
MIAPRRWLPHPLLSLLLLILWLLLFNTLSLAHVLFGLLLGILMPLFTQRFWPGSPRVRRPLHLARYALLVLGDILIANVQVARLILGPVKKLHPAFVIYPLDLREDFSITLLASTISLTPGTVSADVSPDRRSLLIHALDVDDEVALIAHIKQRYETPLREIFEC